ncbi:unnamed protein product [Triticum turgidum subsp. durum]|uniref:Uncharacterized protein n=1 Tax=Triticum turgidum subsp. durum TaxID=4567 RepID=A0A9R0V8M0_TRITD|nr:unnamed protein product [Triticum turgidum subsp. durum]
MPKAWILRELQPAAAAYFGELEEALIHGTCAAGVDPVMIESDAHTKSAVAAAAGYLAARPPTLEIFPSWPMSHLQQPYSGNSQSVGSTDSSSAQNTMSQAELVSPVSMRTDSGQQQQDQQEALMVTIDDYNYSQGLGAAPATAPSFQQHAGAQDKRKPGSTRKDGKLVDPKTERRLAQNREAARKSRLRKKAYVQQLETGRIRLQQIEQELQRGRSQGLLTGGCSAPGEMSSAAVMFDMEYARWLDEDNKYMAEIQGALQAQVLDADLGTIVEDCMRHHDELFHLRAMLARSDVFHLMTGMWATQSERCFLWMAGFRPSEVLKKADNLRQQTLHHMRRILTTRQTARCFVSLGEYHRRLRALSSIWASRPRENFMMPENVSSTATEFQAIHHQSQQNQFSGL